MSKYKPIKKETKEFVIMNRDAHYYSGLRAGDVVWTDDIKQAKKFTDENNVVALKRWKPQEEIEIVYV